MLTACTYRLPPHAPILPMLQQHGAHLLAGLLSLNRTPEPSRVPQPVRPDAPSRPHMPPRQPYPRARNRRRQMEAAACGPWRASNPLRSLRQAKRPRRMGLCSEVADGGENLEDHPALASRYVCRKAPFQHANCPAIRLGRVEPFSFRPDKILPGTLHHSGIRPAPPSDHTPLARRSAFRGAAARPAREFERARGVETLVARRFLPCRGAARYLSA